MNARAAHPIERFLGRGHATGPFDLLSLPSKPLGDAQILDALRTALQKVDDHPERDTPAADEVRLALHAAAAQLLDPEVQRALLERFNAPSIGKQASNGSRAAPPNPDAILIKRDTNLAIAVAGGWNDEALRILTALAHARGLDINRLVAAIEAANAPQTSAAPSTQVARDESSIREAEHAADRPQTRRKTPVIALAVLVVGAIATAALLIIVLTSDADPPTQASAPQNPSQPPQTSSTTSSSQSSSASSGSNTQQSRTAQLSPPSHAELIEDIRLAQDISDTEPDLASEMFLTAALETSRSWTTHRPDQRAALLGTLLECLLAIASDPTRAAKTMEQLSTTIQDADPRDPIQLRSLTFLTGFAARVEAESEIPASATRAATFALTNRGIQSPPSPLGAFEYGARELLRVITTELASNPEPAAWEAWIACVNAIAPGSEDLAAELTTRAIDGIAIEASSDTAASKLNAITLLAQNTDWTREPAREWLIAALPAQRISSDAMHVITRAVVDTDTEGVFDRSMIVAASANTAQRAQIRERFRLQWGIDLAEADRASVSELLRAIEDAERRVAGSLSLEDSLASAVESARLATVGHLLWIGLEPEAASILRDIRRDLDASPSPPPITPFDEDSPDTTWVTRYLTLPDARPKPRLDLIAQRAGSRAPLTTIEAEVLVEEGTRARQREVREAAYQLAWSRRQEPRVINAVLEQLPVMPASAQVARLVEGASGTPLPPRSDAGWRDAARAALVRRLLDVLARNTRAAELDRLAELLSLTYAERAQAPSRSLVDLPPPAESLEPIREELQELASRSLPPLGLNRTVSSVTSRFEASLSIATSDPQRLLVEQLAVAGFVAVIAASERPERAAEIEAVLTELDNARITAETIVDQSAAAELATAKLFAILLDRQTSQ